MTAVSLNHRGGAPTLVEPEDEELGFVGGQLLDIHKRLTVSEQPGFGIRLNEKIIRQFQR